MLYFRAFHIYQVERVAERQEGIRIIERNAAGIDVGTDTAGILKRKVDIAGSERAHFGQHGLRYKAGCDGAFWVRRVRDTVGGTAGHNISGN